MAVVTVNDHPVAEGTIDKPLIGRPSAVLKFYSPNRLFYEGQRVTLTWFTGHTQVMSVESHVLASGAYQVVLVAGKELSNVVLERYYHGASVEAIVRATITEAGGMVGEVEAPGVLTRYVRRQTPAYVALHNLAYISKRQWRVLDDGRVWFGQQKHEARGPHRIQKVEGHEITLELSPELQPGDLLKGYFDGTIQTFGAITHVNHYVGGSRDSLRTVVYVREVKDGAA